MGRTPKPLHILTLPDVAAWPEWEALRAQGHVIVTVQDIFLNTVGLLDMDLIVGTQAWHLTHKHRKYLKDAIAAARKRRYPKGD